MKNKSIFGLVSIVLFAMVMGCSWWNPLASNPETNKSNTAASNKGAKSPETKEKALDDKAIDTVLGDEKIGVPECDELLESLVAQSESPDDNYVTKAARGYALKKIRESIKKSIEENKNDTVKMAKECKDAKVELDKFKAEEEKKKQ